MTPIDDEKKQVLAEMDSLMRSLRQCDTQATAIAWMTRAYNAMDDASKLIPELERMAREADSERAGLIFHIPKPLFEVVQEIPRTIVHRANDQKKPTYPHNGRTVVYPEFFLHPGLKPAPKAWTRSDTLRLERGAQVASNRIIKKGK